MRTRNLFAIRALETACVEVQSGSTEGQGGLSASSSLKLDACRPHWEPEAVSYNSAISACEKGQQWEPVCGSQT